MDSYSSHVSQALAWLENYRRRVECSVERISFADSEEWSLDQDHFALRHSTGRFFKLQGYRGVSNFRPDFWQPLINQPETGTQGFIIRQGVAGIELLAQARTEPGNVGLVQIGPTIQATYSNYTAVHNGKKQPFLEHFHHPERHGSRVILDTVQPELGSKFLKKWNRNIVIEAPALADYSHPMFTWVPLTTMTQLMKLDHIVNNDARLVVGLLALELGSSLYTTESQPGQLVSESFSAEGGASFESTQTAIDWLTDVRSEITLDAEELSLADLPEWSISADEIRHDQGKYFQVIQVKVHASDREVTDWDQPLVAAKHTGEIVLIAKEIDGTLNLLLQAEPQIGNANGAELQPTQCFDNEPGCEPSGAIRQLLEDERILHSFSVEGSDEGGRFFQCVSRYDIRIVDSSVEVDLPKYYRWFSLGQIRSLLNQTDFVSDEARSAISLFLTAACSEVYQPQTRLDAA